MRRRSPKHAFQGRQSLLDNIVYGVKHDLLGDPVGRKLRELAAADLADTEIESMIRRRVSHDQALRALGELPPFRRPQDSHGELMLDLPRDGEFFGMRRDDLTAHGCVAANTGSGKSNLLDAWALQLGPFLESLWLVDNVKQERRRLLHPYRRFGRDLIVLREGTSKTNVLQTDDRNPRRALNVTLDALIRVLKLPDRAGRLLGQTTSSLFESYGIFQGRKHWPTLFDVFEAIKASTGVNAAAREALLDRLGTFLQGVGPRCAAYNVAWSPLDLAEHHIVFEGHGTSDAVRSLHMDYRLNAVFQDAIEHGQTNRGLRHLIMLDDSQRLLGRSNSRSESGSLLEEFLQVGRGAGIGVVFFLQSPSDLPAGIRANVNLKVLGRLGSAEDWRTWSADLGLDPEQCEWARLNLGPGLYVGSLGLGWREPFLMRVPKLNIRQHVSDRDVERSRKPLEALKTVFAAEYANWSPNPVIRVQPEQSANTASPAAPTPSATTSAATASATSAPTVLDDGELQFLRVVAAHPGRPSSHYAKLAHMSPKRINRLRAQLASKGFIREHKLATGARGRSAIIIELLPPALAALQGGTP
jgi:hypothetical protein